MRPILTLLLPLLLALPLAAQDTTFVRAQPPGSEAELAITYYRIGWTPEQWERLRGRSLTLVYLVDEAGRARLDVIRGADEADIRDSLVTVTARLPPFGPATRGGAPVASTYWLEFGFPDLAQDQAAAANSTIFFPTTIVDRDQLTTEAYELLGLSLFMDVNLFTNRYLGEIGETLRTGGGFDLTLGFRGRRRWGGNLLLGIEFNGKRRLFPEDPIPGRDPLGAAGAFIGAAAEYGLRENKRHELALRAELALGSLTVANKLDPPADNGWVRHDGLHLGLVLNHNLRIGRYGTSVSASDRRTTGTYGGLNLRAGWRYRYYADRSGTGSYFFLGAGYHLGMREFVRP